MTITPDSFRFRPPLQQLPWELRWILERAFDPHEPPVRRVSSPQTILDLARRLGLSSRVAYRYRQERLQEELGDDVAIEFGLDQRQTARKSALLLQLARIAAEVGSETNTTLIFLKGVALLESGVVALGARDVGDVDVLVSPEKAMGFRRGLGLRRLGPRKRADSEPGAILDHPYLGALHLHVSLPGIRLHSEREAIVEDLLSEGRCHKMSAMRTAHMPSVVSLTAHAIVHGLAQHGQSQTTYPFLRMFGDLIDLGRKTGSLDGLIEAAYPLISRAVSQRELRAIADLSRGLAEATVWDQGDAGALVRHAVAISLDRRYRRALRTSAFFQTFLARDWHRIRRQLRPSASGRVAMS